ncbi:MAG: hypothetical protein U1E62_00005 [Alsobacter sp.]
MPPPSSLASYALVRGAMGQIANWIFFPSFVLTLVPSLVSMAIVPAFRDAGWALIKAASGIPLFAGGLHAMAPLQDEARLSAEALAGRLDPSKLEGISAGTTGTMWVLLAIGTANVVLGIWRQRIKR